MKLRKILAGAMALVMVAGSLLVGPVEAKAALVSESKVYDATAVNISAGVMRYFRYARFIAS